MQGFLSPMEILVWGAIVIELFEAALAHGQGGYWADVSILLILQVTAGRRRTTELVPPALFALHSKSRPLNGVPCSLPSGAERHGRLDGGAAGCKGPVGDQSNAQSADRRLQPNGGAC